MIKIEFREPDTQEWRDWCDECATATDEVCAAAADGRDWRLTELYNKCKHVYKSRHGQFFGKCAYCESRFTTSQPGHLDHFRPEKGVTETVNGKRVAVKRTSASGDTEDHPGYYWLAYSWRNLLPSCHDCNSPNGGNTERGNVVGKWNEFPIDGVRAWEPGEEVHEAPLLINPVEEEPAKHLTVDPTGILKCDPKSTRGQACLDVFGLNDRVSLVEARRLAYEEAEDAINVFVVAVLGNDQARRDSRWARIQAIKSGEAAYAAAGRAALESRGAEIRQLGRLVEALQAS